MFHAGQAVFVNRPTHFPHIKQGYIHKPDPEWPGFWEVGTDFGTKWFHESEIQPGEPGALRSAKPKRKPKAPPRTILIPNWEESPSCSP